MARTAKKKEAVKETAPIVTRAEKKDATKNLIRELLAVKPHKHNELIDAVASIYTERFGGEETENINDVKGRVGSVLDIMKKESEVAYDGGMYALKSRIVEQPQTETAESKPVKKARKTAVKAEEKKTETAEEKATKKTAKKAKPLPAQPLQPIAPVDPTTPETAPEAAPKDEKTTPAEGKKRGRKPKAVKEEKTETITPVIEEKKEEIKAEELPKVEVKEEVKQEEKPVEERAQLIVKEKAEVAKKSVVMDMSFLFGDKKPQAPAREVQTVVKTEEKPPVKPVEKAEEKLVAKTEEKPLVKPVKEVVKAPARSVKRVVKGDLNTNKKPLTAEERLKESYLKRIRALGGDYFEYYSVYLLERYCMRNGRRLEGMKINGGDRDGGIDGEIELTDKFGFRETIYIQSKNWDPDKGDEKLWIVGETLLQQFIGACAYRQAKQGKQHCRGIFITTSRFTPEAKRMLDAMSDKIVGYDGTDLFEAAKECSFGLIQKNGEWVLDERLLSGTKAFFNLY